MSSVCQYHIDNRIIVMISCSNSFVCILRERDGTMTRSRVKYRACPTGVSLHVLLSAEAVMHYAYQHIIRQYRPSEESKQCHSLTPPRHHRIHLSSSLINLVWWRYDMKTVFASLSLCEVKHAVTNGSFLQRHSKSDIIWTKNRVIGDLRPPPPLPPPCVMNRSENKIKK